MSPPTLVYLLCLAASLTCALLLLRNYWRSGTRLLLWTGLGFAALMVNNLLLVADKVVWPGADLWALRQASAGGAIAVFLYGFLTEIDA